MPRRLKPSISEQVALASFSRFLKFTATSAPAPASAIAIAIARHMPRLAPVTSAILPDASLIMSLLSKPLGCPGRN
jgi:hypothetical protein